MKTPYALLAVLLMAPVLRAQDYSDEEWVDQPPAASTPAPAAPAAEPKAKTKSEPEPAAAETLAEPEEAPAAEAPAEPEEAPAAEAPAEEPAYTDEAAAPVEEEPAPARRDGASYEVRKGDTLWDLADSFYKDPFLWQDIWKANRTEIRDPDLIYPDQRFVIPGRAAAARPSAMDEEEPAAASAPLRDAARAPATEEAPEAEEAYEEPAAPEPAPARAAKPRETPMESARVPRRHTSRVLESGSFIAGADWKGSGRIVGDRDRKAMISQGDVVYLNVGSSSGARPRTQGVIYRKGRPVRDPQSGDTLGYMVMRVGVLQLTREISDKTSTAVVLNSENPIRVGDFVSLEE